MHAATETAIFEVRVTPNAKKESLEIGPNGILRARVTVPPIDGKANKAVIKLLSKVTGVKKSCICIVKGEKSRNKTMAFAGCRRQDIEKLLR